MDIRPQEGKQEQFLSSEADIVIYGGSAGGGKTYALLLEALRHTNVKNFTCVFFRKTYPQITGAGMLWDESEKIYPAMGAKGSRGKLEWRWDEYSSKVQFRHIMLDKDLLNYQGTQIALICFDELVHFTKKQFFFMLSRNRSVCGVSPYVRATTNPDPDSWLREVLDWWIGSDGYAIEERSGVVRWLINQNDQLFWFDSREAAIEKFGEDAMPKSFTFIPSSVYDNKILLDANPEYIASLKALPRVEREQLLNGNWNIRAEAGDYFQKNQFEVVEAVPQMKNAIRCWDFAGTTPSEINPDPDWTVGTKAGIDNNGVIYILDMVRDRLPPAGVKKLLQNVSSQDGQDINIRIPQDPGSAGLALAHDYVKMLAGYKIKYKLVTGTKESRATPASGQASIGNIKVLRGDWNNDFFRELEGFPFGAHDDIVDTLSDCVEELTNWRKPARVVKKPHMVR